MLNTSEHHLGGYMFGGDPLTFYPKLFTWIVKTFSVRSVLDVGCAEGHSAEYFKSLGCDVLGVEGSPMAIRDSKIPENITQHDFCTGAHKTKKTYEMVWSCEFVEHVEEKYMQNFLESFKSAEKYIFMTHATPGQVGHHHVNCKPKEYWIKVVSNLGFRFCPVITRMAKTRATGHFKRTGLVFINNNHNISLKNKLKLGSSFFIDKLKNILKIG